MKTRVTYTRWGIGISNYSNLLFAWLFIFLLGTMPSKGQSGGNLLFKEDFKGNLTSNSRVGPPLAPSLITYTYYDGVIPGVPYPRVKEYSIYKTAFNTDNSVQLWAYPNYAYDDHTFPGDVSRGYFMMVDGDNAAASFYNFTMDNLCTGFNLKFSLWIMNMNPVSWKTGHPNYVYPNLTFRFFTPGVLLPFATYSTGDIPIDNEGTNSSPIPLWHQYGTTITPPSSSVRVEVVNNVSGSTLGNDFLLDDIELRLDAPSPTLKSYLDATVTKGTPALLEGNFDNSAPVIPPNDLYFKWQFNATNDINGVWTDVMTKTLYTNSYTHTLPNFTESNIGYYRLVVGSQSSIDLPNCRLTSLAQRFLIQPNLPVAFGKVNARILGEELQVNWNTLTEKNNKQFHIEASNDGLEFTTIKTIPSKAQGGNSTETLQYHETISLKDASSYMGSWMLGFGILVSLLFVRKRKWTIAMVTFMGLFFLPGCTKPGKQLDTDHDGKIWIRIVQEDQAGQQTRSNVVTAYRAD